MHEGPVPGLWNMLWPRGLLTRNIHEKEESTMRSTRENAVRISRNQARTRRARAAAGLCAVGMALALSFAAPAVAEHGTLAAQGIPNRWGIRFGPFEICLYIQCTPGLNYCCDGFTYPEPILF